LGLSGNPNEPIPIGTWIAAIRGSIEGGNPENQDSEDSCPAVYPYNNPDDDDDDTISIWKAPKVGQSERLLREGFHPDDFPEGIINDDYFDGSAYFARREKYDKLFLEVQIPEDVYNSRLGTTPQDVQEYPYYSADDSKAIGTEVVIPSRHFDMLNNAKRKLHEVN
jgi:hypothetical protein